MKYFKKMKTEEMVDLALLATILFLTYKMMGGSLEMMTDEERTERQAALLNMRSSEIRDTLNTVNEKRTNAVTELKDLNEKRDMLRAAMQTKKREAKRSARQSAKKMRFVSR